MKTIEELSKELKQAYHMLTTFLEQQAVEELQYMAALEALTAQRKTILRDTEAKDLGANEAQRSAKIDGLCAAELQQVVYVERKRVMRRMEVETARLQVEALRCELRLLEVGLGIQRAA